MSELFALFLLLPPLLQVGSIAFFAMLFGIGLAAGLIAFVHPLKS